MSFLATFGSSLAGSAPSSIAGAFTQGPSFVSGALQQSGTFLSGLSSVASTALQLTGTALSIAQSLRGGEAAQRGAAVDAAQLRRIGAIEASDRRRALRRLIAAQTVAFAGSGVDVQLGSPLDVLGDTVAEGELDALRVRFERESQARALEARGAIARESGRTAALGTVLGATGRFIQSQSRPRSN